MKVLQIADYIYPQISGIGVVAMDIAQVLKSSVVGEKQKIICINHNVARDGKWLNPAKTIRHRVHGIEIIRCKMDFHIASQPVSFSYIRILKKVMNSFMPDVVIFHYPNPYFAEFLLQYKKRPFKLIVWWHSDIIKQKLLGKLFIKQNMDLLKRADGVVATSQNYIDGSRYLTKFKSKCTVIPCCVKKNELRIAEKGKAKAEKIKPSGKIMCFSMGRHVTYKGLEYLIEASRYLDNRFEFYIGSSGPLTAKLKKKTENDARFHFTGHLNEEDLCAYYFACDIFCFPSITRNEAFGIALADALYYGKPAVTFTIPGSGVNFVNLNGVTGIECRNKDSRQYARAIQKLADDERLRRQMGKNAHQRAEELLTFEIFQKHVLALLDTVFN